MELWIYSGCCAIWRVDWEKEIARVNPSWDWDRAGEEEENSNLSRDLGVKFGGRRKRDGVSIGVY